MNKTALITGASSGIGLELAKIMASKSIDLILVARSEQKLKTFAAEFSSAHGIKCTVLAKDLNSTEAPLEIFNYCKEQSIHIDFLINNAGFGDFCEFVKSNWEKQIQMINLNITALTYLTHLFLPAMVDRKSGRIMQVASTASFQPGPSVSVYYATKAYVLHFSEAIANELEGSGVSVTALCLRLTESGFQAAADLEESKLVKGRKLPSAKQVAQYGYKAMMKGEKVAIHGTLNYLMTNSIRFIPRNLVLKMVRYIQDK